MIIVLNYNLLGVYIIILLLIARRRVEFVRLNRFISLYYI
jgi:hypothetical protein